MLLFVLYAQIIASGQNTVNKMQNQRFYFILAYKKSQFTLCVTHKINRTDVKALSPDSALNLSNSIGCYTQTET